MRAFSFLKSNPSCPKIYRRRSGGLTVIEVEKPAEARAPRAPPTPLSARPSTKISRFSIPGRSSRDGSAIRRLPVFRIHILDLLLENPAEPHRKPRCQKLERQRELETCPSCDHGSAKIPASHASPRLANQEKTLDITTILADSVSAQNAKGCFGARIIRVRQTPPLEMQTASMARR